MSKSTPTILQSPKVTPNRESRTDSPNLRTGSGRKQILDVRMDWSDISQSPQSKRAKASKNLNASFIDSSVSVNADQVENMAATITRPGDFDRNVQRGRPRGRPKGSRGSRGGRGKAVSSSSFDSSPDTPPARGGGSSRRPRRGSNYANRHAVQAFQAVSTAQGILDSSSSCSISISSEEPGTSENEVVSPPVPVVDTARDLFYSPGYLQEEKPLKEVHLRRRVIFKNIIYQYYQEIPEKIKALYNLLTANRVNDEKLQIEIGADNPKEGIQHLWLVDGFDIGVGDDALYLGHLLDGHGVSKFTKPTSYLKSLETSKVIIADSFLWSCDLCVHSSSINVSSRVTWKGSSNALAQLKSRHFAIQHKEKYGDFKKQNTVVLGEGANLAVVKVAPYPKFHPTQITFEVRLLDFLISTSSPFHHVKDKYFKAFVLGLDSKLTIPTEYKVNQLLETLVIKEVKPAIKKRLQQNDSLALILDGWSTSKNESVVGVRIISVSAQFQWKIDTIAVKNMIGSHTSQKISDFVRDILDDWGLLGKIHYIMSDNGANYLKASGLLEDIGTFDFKNVAEFLQRNILRSDSSQRPLQTQDKNESSFLQEKQDALDFLPDIVDPDESGEKETMFVPFRSLCNNRNGCKFNTCLAHSVQVLLKSFILMFPRLKAIADLISDLASFCNNKAEVKRKIKERSGITMTVPAVTRWSYIVKCADRLVKIFSVVRDLIIECRAAANNTELKTLPFNLTQKHYLACCHFFELLNPLVKLTDFGQKDGITAPQVIPAITNCFIELSTLRPLEHFKEEILYILAEFPKMVQPYTQDFAYHMATVLTPRFGVSFFEANGQGTNYKKSLRALSPIGAPKIWVQQKEADPVEGVVSEDVEDLSFLEMPEEENFELEILRKKRFKVFETLASIQILDSGREATTSFTICTAELGIPSCKNIVEYALSNLPVECTKKAIPSAPSSQSCEDDDLFASVQVDAHQSKSEWDRYLYLSTCEVIPTTTRLDASGVKFWIAYQDQLPFLSQATRSFYVKPSSTGGVERLFSTLGFMNARQRCNTKAETMELRQLYREHLQNRGEPATCQDSTFIEVTPSMLLSRFTPELYEKLVASIPAPADQV